MNRKTYLSVVFMLFVVVGIALSGCSSSTSENVSNSTNNQPSTSETTTNEGGELVIAVLSDATQLDPHLGTDIPSANVYHGKIYEGLVLQDQNMEIQPALATEWEKVDDFTWEFTLRQGVKFHDGTDFTAEAVKRTIERVLDPETGSPRRSLFEMITEVIIVDDHTVQLKTGYPFTPLLANLAHYSGGIISPKAIDEVENLGQSPAGTGPFKFESWDPGDQIRLVKNEGYWGNIAKVDSVVFKVIPEDSTRVSMVETGEAHIAEPIPVNVVDYVSSSPTMKLNRSDGLGIDYIGFNISKEPFNDVRVRQAINLAIDTDIIVEGVYNGVGTPATAPMGPGVWGHNPDLEAWGYDVEKAKQLLKEAGFPNGFKTTIWTNDNRERMDVAEVAQSQLKGIGIDVEIVVVEWGAYLDKTAAGEHDMFILGWSNMTGDADYNQYFLFHSEAQGTVGNRTFYSNARVDELINLGRQESEPEKRHEYYKEAQAIEMEEAPKVFLRNTEYLVALGSSVEGFWMHPSRILMIADVTIK